MAESPDVPVAEGRHFLDRTCLPAAAQAGIVHDLPIAIAHAVMAIADARRFERRAERRLSVRRRGVETKVASACRNDYFTSRASAYRREGDCRRLLVITGRRAGLSPYRTAEAFSASRRPVLGTPETLITRESESGGLSSLKPLFSLALPTGFEPVLQP